MGRREYFPRSLLGGRLGSLSPPLISDQWYLCRPPESHHGRLHEVLDPYSVIVGGKSSSVGELSEVIFGRGGHRSF